MAPCQGHHLFTEHLLPCDHHLHTPCAPKWPLRICSPAQQDHAKGPKPSQSHLNELHHLLGLRNGDCQLLQLVLRIAEEFGLLGLRT